MELLKDMPGRTAQEIADAHLCTDLCETADIYAIGADGKSITIHDNGATEE